MPQEKTIEIESIKEIFLLNEKNNQIRFEAVEKQIEKLTDTVGRIAISMAEYNTGLDEFRRITKNLLNQIDDNKADIKILGHKVELLNTGASGSKVMFDIIWGACKIIFTASIGGSIATWWFLVRNNISPPS